MIHALRPTQGSNWLGRAASALGLMLCAWVAWLILDWAVWHAVFKPDVMACQALQHQGACWGVVVEKMRPILLGHYPYEQQWRPVVVLVASALLCLSAWLAGWRRAVSVQGLGMLLGHVMAATALMRGGFGGLELVPFDAWGGLPLTLWLFLVSLLASTPLAIGLALARRSARIWLSMPATACIEVIRGVPLVTLLFMAAFMLPVLIPQEHPMPLVWRATLALTLFSAVYMAEVIRGGLQTVAQEQSEAAAILGLSWWQTQRMVVLPQALRAVLPALVGHGIGLLKDSSLVLVVGLHEFTGGLSLSLGGDPVWRPYYFEAYLAVGMVYALMCLGLSRTGRMLEQRWAKGTH
ncbi:amino acid ABC transporter permease [Aquabacterium sp. NJ1]|uniref:amino acid ABC transporter permease n=1 Tax=Aquabacterium sp. NJ1 TaxID=1538295 RepID=UPI0006915C94|nr:amino acid ABC transporter permease [Aquabacterium sp. NJ1]